MKDLDRIHKIGELAAAIAVVLSLLFVGYEVRQNSIALRQEATRSTVRDWSDAVAVFGDPYLVCVDLRLNADAANLTFREASHIGNAYWRVYKAHEELHYQYQQGMIDESVWNGFRRTAAVTLSTQGLRDWWQVYRYSYSERFQQYIEGIITETPLRMDAVWLTKGCDDVVGEEYWQSE